METPPEPDRPNPPPVATRLGKLAPITRLLDAGWIDRDRLDTLLVARRAADELGSRVYLALACLFMFGVSGPTSIAEMAGVPLWICFFIHIRRTFKLWRLALVDPRLYLLLALLAWMTASLLWSGNPQQGFEELGALRWMWCVVVLYPVLDQRRLLIAAYVLGLLAGNASQLAHALQDTVGIELFTRAPGRVSGWWDPVVGGSILCAALGMHLPAAMMGVGRTRWLGIAGSVITLAGIAATGTRGAWIAAAMLIAIVGLVAILRVRPRRKAFVPAGIVAGVLGIALSAAAFGLRDSAYSTRVTDGFQDVRAAISKGDFRSDTGKRLYMNLQAAQAFASHPLQGLGAGGYLSWVNARDPENIDIPHPHAHSAPLHAAATLGLVGLSLMGLLLVSAFRGGLRAAVPFGSYSAGPIFAILGLLLVGLFDTVQVNAQTAAQLAVLIAICPPVLPTQFSRK